MLFMVIEHFRQRDVTLIGERFRRSGRMLPEEIHYRMSWVDEEGARCFQLMEAPDAKALDAWVLRWNDLIEFEVIPVETSAVFWSKRQSE